MPTLDCLRSPYVLDRHAVAHLRRLATGADTAALVALERALVRKHLHDSGLVVSVNETLLDIAGDTSPEARATDTSLSGVGVGTLDCLVKAFELLVPSPENGGGPGSVFTPQPIAEALAEGAISTERRDSRVVDPSCGAGALLVAALRRIHQLHDGTRDAGDIIADQLWGVDVDADSVRRAQLLLTLAAVGCGDDRPRFQLNVRCADSLDPGTWDPTERWDVVLQNPPYVRFQELSVADRRRHAENFEVLSKGNFNLFFAFFELTNRLRAPGGAAALITPNAYFRAASAQPLREWMVANSFPTRVVDFGGSAVFDAAMTYTALTFSDPPDTTGVLRYTTSTGACPTPAPASYASFTLDELGAAPWRLVGPADKVRIDTLTAPTPLAELVDIRVGVATLRDNLFLCDGTLDDDGYLVKSFGDRTFRIEHGATRPAVKVSQVSSQGELDSCATRIIFPYRFDDSGRAVVLSEAELDEFPHAREYLEAVAPELALRDKGNKIYAAWFAYGRTQGLAPAAGPRLLTPLYASAPRFLRETNRDRMFLNGCSVTPSPNSPLTIELAEVLLNSAVFHYYIERTSSPITGGYFSYQKSALARFGVPDAVFDAAAELTTADPETRDVLLCDLYGVTLPEEYVNAQRPRRAREQL